MELVRFKTFNERGFMFINNFVYLARRITPNPIYEYGYRFFKLKTLKFNFKNKPKISLPLFGILMFIPYIAYLLYWYTKQVITLITWLILYILFVFYKDAIDDFAWDGRFLLYPLIFWQALALFFAYQYFFK